MNPPAKTDKPRGQLFPTLGFVSVLAALAIGVWLLASGCGKPPGQIKTNESGNGAKSDPWETAARRFRKDSDLTACKSALTGLNNDLARAEKGDKPGALTNQAEEALAKLVPLNEGDRNEIRGSNFSPHDPIYLSECLFLRDAARSLSIPGLSPEQQADLGFAWVCRQVVLSAWFADRPGQSLGAAALPPMYILRRGSGSAQERMYVFLALLQQLGLDGCLLGPPDPGEILAHSAQVESDMHPMRAGPRGPFWAVGVRVGNEVKLYDPWREVAFPAPFGKLKATPEAYKTWFDDASNQSGLTVDAFKTAVLHLAVPVNSLAPRMVILEEKLKADVGVKLSINPAALQAAFPDPKPAFWNPPNDQFAYGRTARKFLPMEEGGDSRPDKTHLTPYQSYFLSQLPSEQEVALAELRKNKDVMDDVKNRTALYTRSVYGAAFLEPPTPRERVQRGQFQEAARTLVERQDDFGRSLLRVRNFAEADKHMREWAEKAREIYRSFGTDPNAGATLDAHWRTSGASLLLDRMIGEMGQAEAALLLALCKHEQAERLQAQFEHAAAPEAAALKNGAIDAWKVALSEWRSYREQHATAQAGSQGLADHVKKLAGRAEKLAQQPR